MAKNKPKSFTAIALILCAGMLLLWLAGMGMVTLTLAAHYQDLLVEESSDYASKIINLRSLDNYFQDYTHYYDYLRDPTRLELEMVESIGALGNIVGAQWNALSSDDLILSRRVPASSAVLVLDEDGDEALCSTDSLYVTCYQDQNEWENGGGAKIGVWMDLGSDPELAAAVDHIRAVVGHDNWNRNVNLRITGHMVGARLIPTEVCYKYGSGCWINVLERVAPEEHEQITIYTDLIDVFHFDEGGEASYMGKTYSNLLALLRKTADRDCKTVRSLTNMYLFDTAVLGFRQDGPIRLAYTIRTVVRCNPLLGAMNTLLGVYIESFLWVCLVLAMILLIIRRNLTRPLAVLDAHMAGDFLPQLKRTPQWREPLALEAHFQNWQKERKELLDQQKKLEDTVNRLRQALEYAGKAEENRRRMISALAHELKTPLAVIHSYTEGLQENIADDKRDQYLQTLLEESEQMDALVMEMLDLSRLESGRVVLARDRFCLTELAKEVFGRMEKLAKEKGLQVEYELNRSMEVCADEGRIRQAVRNLASNAVRYTRTGGRIFVKTAVRDGFCVLTVENDAQSFTEEELGLVWESFYRKDPSREGKGTGLGLAIVRNILKLHGGGSFVRNTESGVEFSIRLPQK